ncbi:hypothetical protein FB451DRAFT_448337 [Mycena latifolia]|nr:hypothetical protein FB451DRAFT_448337 [Mycena latifolia]
MSSDHRHNSSVRARLRGHPSLLLLLLACLPCASSPTAMPAPHTRSLAVRAYTAMRPLHSSTPPCALSRPTVILPAFLQSACRVAALLRPSVLDAPAFRCMGVEAAIRGAALVPGMQRPCAFSVLAASLPVSLEPVCRRLQRLPPTLSALQRRAALLRSPPSPWRSSIPPAFLPPPELVCTNFIVAALQYASRPQAWLHPGGGEAFGHIETAHL